MIEVTERQAQFILTLLDTREVPEDIRTIINSLETLSKADASKLINDLTKFPNKEVKTAQEVEEGFYFDGTNYYRVVKSGAGRLYAKRLIVSGTSGSWEFAPGALRNFAKWSKITKETASTFGRTFGVCLACGRTLTDPKSISAGIGPVCAGKF